MSKRMLIALGVAGGALLLAACSGASSEAPPNEAPDTGSGETIEVLIDNFVFEPQDLTVSVGDTVTWRNEDGGIPHTATADAGDWDSGSLGNGDTYSFTFTEPGTYTYLCTIHPSMTGTITVTAG